MPTRIPMAKFTSTESTVTSTMVTHMYHGSALRRIIEIEDHLKVWMTTTKRMPQSAAVGTASMKSPSTQMKSNMKAAAVRALSRPWAPFSTLMVLWPIMASPPMALKKPDKRLARPWARHSWFFFGMEVCCSRIWSTACRVRTDSTKPMAHKEPANGRLFLQVSHLPHGTSGMCHCGSPPVILDKSLTNGVDQPNGRTIPHSYAMAASRPMSEGGTSLANLTLPHLYFLSR
mmetsp:Transcript_51069/g.118678  ORF Transcript_51069/g.118678 Transcript_51069/m.118678 type:complete len:231 (+) Transcript_51069:1216-1908(+)